MSGIKRSKLDIVFSNLIRERENYYCVVCHENFRYGDAFLDCAHIMGRRNVATRWHPLNAIAMCRSDHMFFTEHPFDFYEWAIGYFGADCITELRRVAKSTVKWPKHVREEIYKHYKLELARMEALRAQGNMKCIEIVVPECMQDFAQEIIAVAS